MNHDSAANPPSSMVTGEMTRLLQIAIAPSTRKTYTLGWNKFCQFKGWRQDVFSSVFPHDIWEFVAWLSLRGLAPSTISTYVAGVGFFHKINGQPDPTQDFLVIIKASCRLLQGSATYS